MIVLVSKENDIRKDSVHIGVVILNFNTWKDTIECTHSFLNQKYENYSIVIVDNGSSDQSLERLDEEFSCCKSVYILKSNENLGFAKGNNLGIRYARETLGCRAVIVINSDTIVQESFISEMADAIEEGVAVISPYVVHSDGKAQQPAVNTDNIQMEICRTIFMNFLTEILHSNVFRGMYGRYRMRKSRNTVTHFNRIIPKKYFLQGCAYMLTEDFFRHYTQLYPNTFLYWEELNLLYYIQKAGMCTKYVHTSPVLHKVAVSTQYLLKNRDSWKKKRMLIRHGLVKSIPLYFSGYRKIRRNWC